MSNSYFYTPYQQNNSILAKLDARIKLILALCLALTITLLSSLPLLTFLVIITVFLIFAADVEFHTLFKRLVPLLPFILPVLIFLPFLIPGKMVFSLGDFRFSLEGIKLAIAIICRMLSIVFVFTALVSSTPQGELLMAIRQLGIPLIFLQIIQFALRYMKVLASESKTMLTAMKSRGYEKHNYFNLREIKYLGSLIGMLLLRSFSRAERIYLAMLSRGYSSDIIIKKGEPVAKKQLILSTGIMLLCILIVVADRGGLFNWM